MMTIITYVHARQSIKEHIAKVNSVLHISICVEPSLNQTPYSVSVNEVTGLRLTKFDTAARPAQPKTGLPVSANP